MTFPYQDPYEALCDPYNFLSGHGQPDYLDAQEEALRRAQEAEDRHRDYGPSTFTILAGEGIASESRQEPSGCAKDSQSLADAPSPAENLSTVGMNADSAAFSLKAVPESGSAPRRIDSSASRCSGPDLPDIAA